MTWRKLICRLIGHRLNKHGWCKTCKEEIDPDYFWKIMGKTEPLPCEPKKLLTEDRAYYIEKMPEEIREQRERQHWFPTPQTRRRKIPRRHKPPAAQHRAAIAKHMKGKGRFSRDYRRRIKRSPTIDIEDD